MQRKPYKKLKKILSCSIAHYDLRFLKPLDEAMLHQIGKKFHRILTIEDGVLKGGMGSAILEFMADNQYTPMVKRLGIEDKFIQHGPVKDLYALCHIDEAGILHALTNMTNL